MRRSGSASLKAQFAKLRAAALACPEAWEDFPWGDRAFKVRKKVFAFIDGDDACLKLTLKLPQSGDVALMLPFTEPTGYGLGKSGWVSARFERGAEVPLAMLLEWLHESYRAVAPSKLAKQLDAGAAPGSAPRSSGSSRSRSPKAARRSRSAGRSIDVKRK